MSGPVWPTEPDEELLRQALQAPDGDLRSFEKLVQRYQRRVIANCRGITRDPNESEDLAQEVLVKAYFGLRSIRQEASFWPWLQRIKINHCLNHLKKRNPQFSRHIDVEEAEDFDELKVKVTAEQVAENISRRDIISAVLESLPDTLRVPLVLCDVDELSYEEVASTLGIGLSATKMRIKRAREEFRARYGLRQATGTTLVGAS